MSILLGITDVFAKDTVFSLKKYEEEKLLFLEKSYDEDNNIDGMVAGGMLLKEEKIEEELQKNYQIILIKYKEKGKVSWSYIEEDVEEDAFIDLDYTYTEERKIDGYLMTIKKLNEEESTIQTVFLKIDLEGNLLWEKPCGLNPSEEIKKIDCTYTENGEIDGYIGIGNTNIIRYDKEMNVLWMKRSSEENSEYKDIVVLQEEQKTVGYILVKEEIKEEEKTTSLIKIDLAGNESVFLSDCKQETISLQPHKNGFIIYGITSEVKLKKGNESYYLLNYDKEGNILWETVGDISIDKEEKLLLLPIDEAPSGYFLLYKNKTDTSYEVIKLDAEGNYIKKIKKIKNNYYLFENFSFIEDVLYFVGQIDCPDEDNCDYKKNSLFLISDEDTVIEVKDNDSQKVIGITTIIFLFLITLVGVRRKKRIKR